MLQDRNVHRDAQALRKAVTVPLIVPAFGVNQDEPIFSVIPRYNFRLTDIETFVNNLTTAVLTVGAQVVEPNAVAGNPRLLQGGAVTTFLIDEFWRRNGTGTGWTKPSRPFSGFLSASPRRRRCRMLSTGWVWSTLRWTSSRMRGSICSG